MTQNRSSTVTWIACIAVGAILGAFGLSRILNVAVAAAVGGVAGSLVAVAVVRARDTKPTAGTADAPGKSGSDADSGSLAKPKSASDPNSPLSDAQILNQINLRIRSRAVAPDLVARIEELIDRLSTLLPTLGGEYAGFELTWQIQRIANTYLPKLVDAYVALTDAQRTERRGEFEQSLRELEDAVARTVKAVDEKNTAEFSNVSAFLKLRFS